MRLISFRVELINYTQQLVDTRSMLNNLSLDWLEGVKRKKMVDEKEDLIRRIIEMQTVLVDCRHFSSESKYDVNTCIKGRADEVNAIVKKFSDKVTQFIAWCESYQALSREVNTLLTFCHALPDPDKYFRTVCEDLYLQAIHLLDIYIRWERFFMIGDCDASEIIARFPHDLTVEVVMDMIDSINALIHVANPSLRRWHESFADEGV